MRLFITALVFLMGMFMIFIAVSLMLQPATTAPSLLGITPDNNHALSSLRGDVQAFFGIIGVCMLWGAWKRSGDLLLVPAIIMVPEGLKGTVHRAPASARDRLPDHRHECRVKRD